MSLLLTFLMQHKKSLRGHDSLRLNRINAHVDYPNSMRSKITNYAETVPTESVKIREGCGSIVRGPRL